MRLEQGIQRTIDVLQVVFFGSILIWFLYDWWMS